MHTCFSEQSPEATRLGRGRAEGGAGSDPTKVYLAQQQADSASGGRGGGGARGWAAEAAPRPLTCADSQNHPS